MLGCLFVVRVGEYVLLLLILVEFSVEFPMLVGGVDLIFVVVICEFGF